MTTWGPARKRWGHWSQDPFQIAMLQIEFDEAGTQEDIPILAEW